MRTTRTIAGLAALIAFALAGTPAMSAISISGSVQYSDSAAIPAAVLTNGDEVEDLEGSAGAGFYFQFYVPPGAEDLQVEVDGDGNVDLYLARGWVPDLDGFEYASRSRDADEEIEIENPASGTWYVLVFGRDDFEDVEIEASWDEPDRRVVYSSYPAQYYTPGVTFYGTFGLNRVRRPIVIYRRPLLHRFGYHRPHVVYRAPTRKTVVVPRVVTRPRVVTPRIYTRPKVVTPRIYTRPKVVTPRIYTRPKVVTPRIYTRPKVVTPRVYTRPKVVTPRVSSSRTSRSRVTPPQNSRSRVSPPSSSRSRSSASSRGESRSRGPSRGGRSR